MQEAKPAEKAGAVIYRDILKFYQDYYSAAQREANHHACAFAESQKPEDRSQYLAAKGRLAAWDAAIGKLASNGGDLMRLDFDRSQ